MRMNSKAFAIPTLVAALAGLMSVQASAQNDPIEFRVVATDRNPASCRQWDSELARVHTFTPAGDTATLRTAGGITRTMTQSSPKVFTTTLALGGTNFNVVADTSKAPGTLEVAEPRTGCRWNAIAR